MIRAGRAILRRAGDEDCRLIAAWMSDPVISAWGQGRVGMPLSWTQLCYSCEQVPGWCLFTITVDDDVIGYATLHQFDFRTGTCSVGIVIADEQNRGRGHGSDIRHALLRYAFEGLNIRRVFGGFVDENKESRGLHRSVGTTVIGRLRKAAFSGGRYRDLIPHVVRRREYLSGVSGWRVESLPEFTAETGVVERLPATRIAVLWDARELDDTLHALTSPQLVRLEGVRPPQISPVPIQVSGPEPWLSSAESGVVIGLTDESGARMGVGLVAGFDWSLRSVNLVVILRPEFDSPARTASAVAILTEWVAKTMMPVRIQFVSLECEHELNRLLTGVGYVLDARYDGACLTESGFCDRYVWSVVEDDRAMMWEQD